MMAYLKTWALFFMTASYRKVLQALDRENVKAHVWNMIDRDSDLDTVTKKYSI